MCVVSASGGPLAVRLKPDTTYLWELVLWPDPADGRQFVTTQYLAQTLDQMRSGAALTLAAPPAIQDVVIPGCDATGNARRCPLDTFARTVRAAIDPQFAR